MLKGVAIENEALRGQMDLNDAEREEYDAGPGQG